jgi:hypothetical protein
MLFALTLHQDSQHVAVLIHSSPKRALLPANLEVQLIKMPLVTT